MIPVALWLAAAAVSWAPREAGKPIPAAVVRAAETEALYVCRAQLPDGVHPGATDGGPCIVPQKGRAQAFDRYELAEGTGWVWRAPDWERAVPAGRQHNSELYVCRARVTSASGRSVFAGGKAYRTGTHAGHCFVAHQGREQDIPGDFELLVRR